MSSYLDQYSAMGGPLNVGLGLGGGLAVGAAATALGGSWIAIPMCALFGIAAGKIFAVEAPSSEFWRRLVKLHQRLRYMYRPFRLLSAAVLVAMVAAVDALSTALDVPLAFYFYVIPIFLSSLLFGCKAGAVAALLSLASVTYFVIPPRNSFAIETLPDVAHLLLFAIVALIVLAVLAIQADLSIVDRDRRDARLRGMARASATRLERAAADQLRAEAYRLIQLARTCSDRATAHELEGISMELMEQAVELERLLAVRPAV